MSDIYARAQLLRDREARGETLSTVEQVIAQSFVPWDGLDVFALKESRGRGTRLVDLDLSMYDSPSPTVKE